MNAFNRGCLGCNHHLQGGKGGAGCVGVGVIMRLSRKILVGHFVMN